MNDENADLLQRLDRWKEGDSNTNSLIRWSAAHLRGEQSIGCSCGWPGCQGQCHTGDTCPCHPKGLAQAWKRRAKFWRKQANQARAEKHRVIDAINQAGVNVRLATRIGDYTPIPLEPRVYGLSLNEIDKAIATADYYHPNWRICKNHDPNGGPGSDQCVWCGQGK